MTALVLLTCVGVVLGTLLGWSLGYAFRASEERTCRDVERIIGPSNLRIIHDTDDRDGAA